jgi:hypothetical protein
MTARLQPAELRERIKSFPYWYYSFDLGDGVIINPEDITGVRGVRGFIIYDLSPDIVGTFDVCLAFRILHHLRHPLLAIERICDVCRSYVAFDVRLLRAEKIFFICEGEACLVHRARPRGRRNNRDPRRGGASDAGIFSPTN